MVHLQTDVSYEWAPAQLALRPIPNTPTQRELNGCCGDGTCARLLLPALPPLYVAVASVDDALSGIGTLGAQNNERALLAGCNGVFAATSYISIGEPGYVPSRCGTIPVPTLSYCGERLSTP